MNIIQETINWGGHDLTIETGRIARQSDGAVLVSYGKTTVLCTCVYCKERSDETDFFPLTVNYQEKFYAAGKIPGGFVKREGKPTDKETLVSRLIDRAIRPLFKEGFYNETQVICTVLSYDKECSPEIAALIGASAAITISGIPFLAPVACCNVGYSEKQGFVQNPNFDDEKKNKLMLTVAGTKKGVLMVEAEAGELSEEVMTDAIMFGHEAIQPVIKIIEKLKKHAGKEEIQVQPFHITYDKLYKKIENSSTNRIEVALTTCKKQERRDAIAQIYNDILSEFHKFASEVVIKSLFDNIVSNVIRRQILEVEKRIDGRAMNEIRPISCDVGVLPCVHGSALFTRGETQALVVATLGSTSDEQVVSDISGEKREKFFLHYNFHPFAVCEVSKLGSPGRREIGHGKLAWRAMHKCVPDKFPYTMRVVSEITESNGSSSMATVCGTSLALMDAGVQIKRPVAGIAMGLVKEGRKCVVLSDISGDEDHLGDMDFKVAGTEKGITALQMDIKTTSLGKRVISTALKQAHEGRMQILAIMKETISKTKNSADAPKTEVVIIDKENIRSLIGHGGKTIKEICEKIKGKIDVSENGIITILAPDKAAIKKALKMIKKHCDIFEVGTTVTGEIVKVTDFGAFVSLPCGRDGLLHISNITKRCKNAEECINVGNSIKVTITGIDDKGKVKVAMSSNKTN